ncbi:MAG: hypothetical protein HF312_21600 [Ignavibacteria bacterium]|jgi:hypothetical protein|nr:hypothetical protein [Ignavibacteria bacterium]
MKNMSAIKALIKAHKAKSISEDTFTLINFLAKFEESKGDRKGIARMELVGLEAKYIPKFDRNSPEWNGQAQGNGFRTRFFLKDGSTVGTFSGAAHDFFKFYAELMGYDRQLPSFLHIDITGVLQVDISKVALDGGKSTYNFEIVEEGSELTGFSEYLPTAQEVLSLEAPGEPTEE